jgi:hypothetical protein
MIRHAARALAIPALAAVVAFTSRGASAQALSDLIGTFDPTRVVETPPEVEEALRIEREILNAESALAVSAAGDPITFYSDRLAFLADSCGELTLEDFEGGTRMNSIYQCNGPIDSATGGIDQVTGLPGGCYPPLQLVPGMELDTFGTVNHWIDVFKAPFIGLTGGQLVGPDLMNLNMHVLLTGPTPSLAAGFDLHNPGGAANWRVEFHGASGLIGSTVTPGIRTGQFVGAIANEPIVEIRTIGLPEGTNKGEIINDLVFGCQPNAAPDCTAAFASPGSMLWPPNHKWREITVGGVVDPDGDPVTITILGVTQDEPTNAEGDGDTEVDAEGVGTPVARIRAERSGGGNGRVSWITFRAADPSGATCDGVIATCAPHDGSGAPCVNDGQVHDATLP